ncbi:MAG: hypothetical protein JWR44_2922 [Hymenobacter sp.]|jgi:hypothetical protein|nr:hypothetical protein [Hymenobacter sp.]
MKMAALLFVNLLLIAGWAFTLYRVYTGEFEGRYTRRRWLVSVLCEWGIIAYWLTGDSQRRPRGSSGK